jgi:hypothetical protein
MSSLYLIVIGAASGKDKKSNFNPAKYEECKNSLKEKNIILNTFCVDYRYDNVSKEETESLSETKVYPTHIQKFEYEFKINNDPVVDIRETDQHAIIIDCRKVKSVYDTMSDFSHNVKNRLFFVVNEEINFEEIVNRYLAGERNYDLYSGALIPPTEALSAQKAIFSLFAEGVAILKCWINANFQHTKEYHFAPATPFAMNMENRFIKDMIRYHSLTFSNSDRDVTAEFATNPQYRQMMCNTLIKICSSFAVSNNLITINQVIEKGGDRSWYSINVWILVESALLARC